MNEVQNNDVSNKIQIELPSDLVERLVWVANKMSIAVPALVEHFIIEEEGLSNYLDEMEDIFVSIDEGDNTYCEHRP